MSAQADRYPDERRDAPAAGPFRRNLSAMLAAVAATLVVQLGAYAAARAAMAPAAATETGLLVGLLWLILAVPIFTAAGEGIVDGLFRGGPVLDASAVLLIVLVASGQLTPLSAVEVYLVWCAIGLTECATVLIARRAANRHLVAAATAVMVLAIAASPFWANGVVLAGGRAWRERAGYALVATNPVFATAACLPAELGFVWNERPILYACTVLSRDVPMPDPSWYLTVAGYGLAAAGLAAVTVARRRP